MLIDRIPVGDNPPFEVNVIIEVPVGSEPVKYELDKASGALYVDRFLHTAMQYPCNYGYIPHTLSDDGDPVDVLVMSPFPIQIRAVVTCRALGLLKMEDEAGGDAKLLAVPIDKLYPAYSRLRTVDDVSEEMRGTIRHFFEHYKDLDKGKWVKVQGWEGPEAAAKEIMDSVERYNAGA